MGSGETGSNGHNVQRHVDLGQKVGQETATIQLQLMEAKNVQDQARSQEFVTQMLVQVNPFKINQCNSYKIIFKS